MLNNYVDGDKQWLLVLSTSIYQKERGLNWNPIKN